MSDDQSDDRRPGVASKTARKKRPTATRVPKKEAEETGAAPLETTKEATAVTAEAETSPVPNAAAPRADSAVPANRAPQQGNVPKSGDLSERLTGANKTLDPSRNNASPDQNLNANNDANRDARELDRDMRGNRATPNQPSRLPSQQPKPVEGTEFSIQVTFDRVSKQHTATVLEFADVFVTGPNRETVIRELEVKVEDKLLSLRESGQPIPEPLGSKKYPDTLTLRPTQALFRKLDVLSRQERTELSELANNLLLGAVERRYEQLGAPRQSNQAQPSQPQGGMPRHHQSGGRDRNRDNREQGQGQGPGQNQGQGQQQQNNRGGRGGRMSQSNYQNTMSNRENFMEYVRNLEKGGPGWKKR